MRKMRTAEEMANYCLENGTNLGWKLGRLQFQFTIIEDALKDNEYVVCCFVTERHIRGYASRKDHYVYALTNQRLLSGIDMGLEGRLYVTSYKDLNSIDVGRRNILVDSIKAESYIDVGKEVAANIKRELQPILKIILKQKTARERANRFAGSIADELIKLKQLLDEGVLTDVEFQKQKDLLLNPGWEEFVVDFEEEEAKEDKKNY